MTMDEAAHYLRIIVDWIGLGHRVDGLDWTGFRKLHPCPTLPGPFSNGKQLADGA